MKVGTDGVMLGAWATADGAARILDVGTGTGVIALMMAQRNGAARITAIDIDSPSAAEAEENFLSSPWSSRLQSIHGDFRTFARESSDAGVSFDLVVSNPPFFVNSLKAPDARRSDARHTDSLSFDELASGAASILSPAGRLAVILPVEEERRFLDAASACSLQLVRICRVSTLENLPPRRVMMELSFGAAMENVREEELSIQKESDFTEGYKSLTKDFYLKF